MDSLVTAARIAGSALTAHSARVRVATENVANAFSTGRSSTEDPYRRKLISFEPDDSEGGPGVHVGPVTYDRRPFRLEHEPAHLAANEKGLVAYPNVDIPTELADIREANRSYIASLQIIRQTRDAINSTIDLLRG